MEISLDKISSKEDSETVTIKRRMYTQTDLEEVYKEIPQPKSWRERLGNHCQCSKEKICYGLLSLIPIILVIKRYKWKNNTVYDFMAGLSVAFMHLPQGLGFGILASLKPVHGLYSTFFGISFYCVFGTSPHVSFGTNAVIALLTAAIVEKETELEFGIAGNSSNSTLADDHLEFKVGIAMAASFLTGVILLAMGFLRLGFITNYLAVSFVAGFTTAAAFHIATSQVNKMFGIKIKSHSGPGKIVLVYVEIISKLAETNVPDLIVGLISAVILLAVKIGINERYAKKMKMPVPIDLILVIIATIISYYSELERRYGIHVVGTIPSGMPVPKLPHISVAARIFQQCFIIAILTFAMTISMAKLCAAIHDYEVDSNQELVAYGATNLLSSFFQCFPQCVAPPRSMILSSQGSKTTLNAVTSAVFILVVLLAAGPLFVALPVSVLAAMIMIAMKNLLLQMRQLPSLWRISKGDFVIMLTTVSVSILVDLDYGLVMGVGVSIFTVIVQSQVSSGQLIGISEKEDVYLHVKGHKHIKEREGVKIFYFNTTLFFATADKFKSELFRHTYHPLNTAEIPRVNNVHLSKDELLPNGLEHNEEQTENPVLIHHIILDCSAMTYIDMAGVNVLKLIIAQYKRIGTEIFLARCCPYMLMVLEKAQVYNLLPKSHVFYDVHDAVTKACGSDIIVMKF